MRALLILTLLLLSACSTMRDAAGKQREIAEKPPMTVGGEADTSATPEAKAGKPKPLPTGLGGDKTHGVTPPPQ